MSHITTELVDRIAAARVNAHAAHYGAMPEADLRTKSSVHKQLASKLHIQGDNND